MARESFCTWVLLGFCMLGRQDGVLCLWVVSRFVLVFCLGFVRSDVRMEILPMGRESFCTWVSFGFYTCLLYTSDAADER